jgi:DNA modification methylase
MVNIKEYAGNPRINDKAVDAVANSIREFGFKQPIVVDKEGVIIAGHTRYKAARKLGLDTVPVLYATDLTDAQVKAYRLADNKTAEFAEWDEDLLGAELIELAELAFDMEAFGFEAQLAEIAGDDFEVEAALAQITEPASKHGDIYALGRHRLMCGDCTSKADVERLMAGEKAHMIWTDPPWNVDYGSGYNPKWRNGSDRQILNDAMSTHDFYAFLYAAFSNMKYVLLDGAMAYVVMSAQEWANIMQVMHDAGFHWSSTLIWNKDHFVLSRKDYHTKYEPIWYGWLGNNKRLCPLTDRLQGDVWDIDRPVSSPEHPTMKPIELVARSLRNSSRKDDLVIDFFGGSGTTMIAAEQAKRVCYMMELDPRYADVICKRYEELFGEKAVRLHEGKEAIPACCDGCDQ